MLFRIISWSLLLAVASGRFNWGHNHLLWDVYGSSDLPDDLISDNNHQSAPYIDPHDYHNFSPNLTSAPNAPIGFTQLPKVIPEASSPSYSIAPLPQPPPPIQFQ